MMYLDGSASGERKFVVIFGSAFAHEGAGALPAEIRVDDPVEGLGKLQVDFHGSRSAAQRGRRPLRETLRLEKVAVFVYFDDKSLPVGSDCVGQVVQTGDDPVQSRFLGESIPLVFNVEASLGVVGLSGRWIGGQEESSRQEQDGQHFERFFP